MGSKSSKSGSMKGASAKSTGSNTSAAPPAKAPAASGSASKGGSPSPAAATASKAPKSFKDTYTLGKELGKGNYSTVYLATRKDSPKEECAVKCIIKKKLTKEDDDALKVEVQILKAVNHPAIIAFLGFFEDPVEYYIVTEVMGGGELFDRIVAKDFYSEAAAQQVVRTLANCLKYLHDKDIVHRDLKPENILLKDKSDDAAIKIADFGFARYVESGCKTACGTPGYVAPEIVTGMVYGKGVDVWSLGIIIYILLCGYPPFYHKNQNQLFKLIREAKYEFDSPYWDNISDTAKSLIRGCLVVDMKKRFTIDKILEHPWVSGTVANKDIKEVLGELKKFNARRKLRAGIRAAIAANKIKDLAALLKA